MKLNYQLKLPSLYQPLPTKVKQKVHHIIGWTFYNRMDYSVLGAGLEPASLTARDFKSLVYTIPPPEHKYFPPQSCEKNCMF